MVRERFGKVCINPMADLMNLWHKTTVDDYYYAFDTIINRLNLSQSYPMSCFLGGLKKDWCACFNLPVSTKLFL